LELCGSMAQHSNPMYMYSSSPPRDWVQRWVWAEEKREDGEVKEWRPRERRTG
jgi:hypothetical protein